MSDLIGETDYVGLVWGSCVLKWVSDRPPVMIQARTVWGSCVLKWVSDKEYKQKLKDSVWGSCVLKWVSDYN